MDIKRYDMDFSCECGRFGDAGYYEEKNGEWLKYEDVKKKYDIDLVYNQLIGFRNGKNECNIITLIESAGLKNSEWETIKNDYCVVLDDEDILKIEAYFGQR